MFFESFARDHAERRIETLEAENAALKGQLAALSAVVNRLAERVAAGEEDAQTLAAARKGTGTETLEPGLR